MRRILFWLHLSVGSAFGFVILFLALTGMLLAFQRQVLGAMERRIVAQPLHAGQNYLPAQDLLRRAAKLGSAPPAQLIYFARQNAPVMFQLDRFSVLYMNPYSGESLGHGAVRCRAFFRTVEGLHRWFGAWGSARPYARQVKGIASLAFFFMVASGVVLWWPRALTWRHFRPIVWFRSRASGRARNWNWHNVAGIWCAIPLLLILLTGLVLQYPWANALLYASTGNTPPGPDHVFKPAGAARLLAGKVHWQLAVDRALRWQPGWKIVTMNVPDEKNAPIVFTVDTRDGSHVQDQGQLELDPESARVVRWTSFSSKNRGEQLRELARWTHTGESAGLLGQVIAFTAAAGAALLVITGLVLAWDRLRSFQRRRQKIAAEAERGDPSINRAFSARSQLPRG